MPTLCRRALISLALVLCGRTVTAQVVSESVDLSVVQKIKDEGMTRSKLDDLALYLNDVIGARLTNSPASRRANEWAAETFRSWGLANVKVEPWDSAFGRGWEIVSYSGRILEPWPKPLAAYPQAWSGGTLVKGKPATLTCQAVILDVKDSTDIAKYTGKLRGTCVLRGAPRVIPPEFTPAETRQTLDELINWQPRPPGQPGNFGAAQRLNVLVAQLLHSEQPVAVLQPSAWTYGLFLNGGHFDGRTARDSVYNPIPNLIVAHEQYGSLWRIAQRGLPVKLELNLQTRFLDDNRFPTNVTAEISGTDKADEVVMLGAHYDSWHSGTGATDNGAGSVVMMEAIRILKTLGLPLRRTVRIGLWTGEEQGLIGSRTWLRIHKAELPKISAYVNVDNGTGRLRGIWDQSNSAAIPIFQQILAPFQDMGVVAVRHGNTGGTDHLSFVAQGVPGFNFIQDPIEYGTRTHHSNVDTYERLVIDDLKQAATVVAWTVYELANRQEMMPRPPEPRPATP
ncbi:MAG TPA: M20/M25/M40 family metallo-hydrolase [Gemmatimonadales bacterium]|nr:M20/M25/M40 family metallo-hydrolase [Gemmatimonadales bacterium]